MWTAHAVRDQIATYLTQKINDLGTAVPCQDVAILTSAYQLALANVNGDGSGDGNLSARRLRSCRRQRPASMRWDVLLRRVSDQCGDRLDLFVGQVGAHDAAWASGRGAVDDFELDSR